jgi:hypothetical protein
MSSGSGNWSTDTSAGPIGPKVSKLLPSENCGGAPVICTTRSEMSWPSVRPATCDQASARRCGGRRPSDDHDQLDLPVDGVAGEHDVGGGADEAARELGER